MLGTILLIILVLALLGSLPTWPYSGGWGYYPSGGLGLVVVILLVLLVTSKGSAGVAGAGFVTLAATLASMHTIPVAGLVLLLGVERLTNIPRAVVNVIGSSVATIVVAKWEGAFDSERARLVFDQVPVSPAD